MPLVCGCSTIQSLEAFLLTMKTIKDLKKLIEDLTIEAHVAGSERTETKIKNRISVVRDAIIYLELKPRQEFIDKELEKLRAEALKIRASFICESDNMTTSFVSKLRKQHEDKYDMQKIKDQIKFLELIV